MNQTWGGYSGATCDECNGLGIRPVLEEMRQIDMNAVDITYKTAVRWEFCDCEAGQRKKREMLERVGALGDSRFTGGSP